MDAQEVIEFYRTALLRLVMTLFQAAGIEPGGAPVARLSKPVRLLILRVLLPAESATRRLAIYLARRLPKLAEKTRAASATNRAKRGDQGRGDRGRSKPQRAPVFRLFDPRKFFWELADPNRRFVTGPGPMIRFFDERDPVRETAVLKESRDPDDATRLCRRLQALLRALDDLPALARRMQRAMEKCAKAPPGPKRQGPRRPGLPPGYRQRHSREIDGILYECDILARRTPAPEP